MRPLLSSVSDPFFLSIFNVILLLVPLSFAQVSQTVTSFNNVGGTSFDRVARISENAIVGKQVKIESIFPDEGSATGGTHVHVRGSGFAVDTYGGSNRVFVGDRRYEDLGGIRPEDKDPRDKSWLPAMWFEAPVIEVRIER